MIHQTYKIWLFAAFIVAFSNGFLRAEVLTIDGLKIQADVIYTDEDKGKIIRVIAIGNAHVTFEETSAEADYIEFQVKKELMELRGHVVVKKGDNIITSKANPINRSKKAVWDLDGDKIDLGPIVPITYEIKEESAQ